MDLGYNRTQHTLCSTETELNSSPVSSQQQSRSLHIGLLLKDHDNANDAADHDNYDNADDADAAECNKDQIIHKCCSVILAILLLASVQRSTNQDIKTIMTNMVFRKSSRKYFTKKVTTSFWLWYKVKTLARIVFPIFT